MINLKKKKIRCDLPEFMKYTKEVKSIKNGKKFHMKK